MVKYGLPLLKLVPYITVLLIWLNFNYFCFYYSPNLNGNFHTTRPLGRPRTRWADVVQGDALQLLGIRGWRRRPANRDKWRRFMRKAKARKGL